MIIFSIINIFLINIFETHVNSYLHNYYNLSRFNKACISFKYIYIYTLFRIYLIFFILGIFLIRKENILGSFIRILFFLIYIFRYFLEFNS